MALLHYTFENEEHAIVSRPHGNSKSQLLMYNTAKHIAEPREVSQHVPPKQAVSEVSRSVRGTILCFKCCSAPKKPTAIS